MDREYDRDEKGNIKKKKTAHYIKMDLEKLGINEYLHLTIKILIV